MFNVIVIPGFLYGNHLGSYHCSNSLFGKKRCAYHKQRITIQTGIGLFLKYLYCRYQYWKAFWAPTIPPSFCFVVWWRCNVGFCVPFLQTQVSVLHLWAVSGMVETPECGSPPSLSPGRPLLLCLPRLVHGCVCWWEGAAWWAVQTRYFTVSFSPHITQAEPSLCSALVISDISALPVGEHVTSWFKNEVERMGFDTQNAWRISDINSKFRYSHSGYIPCCCVDFHRSKLEERSVLSFHRCTS